MGGHANRDNNIDVTYLPISMGYRSCYKRYMKALGYDVRTTPMGGFVVTAEDEGHLSNILKPVEERLQEFEGKSAGGGHL